MLRVLGYTGAAMAKDEPSGFLFPTNPKYLRPCKQCHEGHDCMDAGVRTNQDEYRTYSGENVRNKFSRQSRGSPIAASTIHEIIEEARSDYVQGSNGRKLLLHFRHFRHP